MHIESYGASMRDVFGVPETLRSHGVAAKVAPTRLVAWATFEVLRYGEAIVEVTYLGNELWTGTIVQIRNPRIGVDGVDPLYEAAYQVACVAARGHGYEIDRFSRKAAA